MIKEENRSSQEPTTYSIAVAGKGGTGKSTLAALLVETLCELNRGPILAIDADPDANLGTLLGIKAGRSLGQLREDVRKELNDLPAGLSKASYIEAGLHQIIDEAHGFDLLTMGRSEGAGCYCYLNNLIRKFSTALAPAYRWLVIDNEAGLEHISRQTTSQIDLLLLVVNDNPLSFDCARRISQLTRTLDNRIKQQYLVSNMVRPERQISFTGQLTTLAKEIDIASLCEIPYDAQLEDLIRQGASLKNVQNAELRESIKQIINVLGG